MLGKTYWLQKLHMILEIHLINSHTKILRIIIQKAIILNHDASEKTIQIIQQLLKYIKWICL